MFQDTVNKEELAQVAAEFKELLLMNAVEYPEAQNILNRAEELIEKAINQKIEEPYRKGFFPEAFRCLGIHQTSFYF